MQSEKTNITFSKDIAVWLDKVLDTDKAKTLGLTSRPDVVIAALRDYLLREFPLSVNPEPKGKNVIVKDSTNGSFISLDIFADGQVICTDCQLEDCIHVKRITSDRTLMRKLKKDGLV